MRPNRDVALSGVLLCTALAAGMLWQSHRPRLASDSLRDAAATSGKLVETAPQLPAAVEVPAPEPEVIQLETSLVVAPASLAETNLPKKQPVAPKKRKDPIKDPLAREALAWVGCDGAAEAYWVQAINDPNLPAQERQDLIEDLNEDGLSDPKQPTLADLPLIFNRLELIEWLAPGAMDGVNADAFMEAYRDLVNLAQVCFGAGEPVK